MKKKFNKLLSIILGLVLSVSTISPIYAETLTKSESISPVKLTAEPIVFNVTVPSSLPVDVDSKGKVTVATDVKITNNSAAPISITGIQVNPIQDWSIVPMNKDFKGSKIGTKEFGFVLNSDEVPTNGTVSLTKSNWLSINGNSSLPLVYDSVIAPQKNAISGNKIADVVFTIGWDAAEPEAPVAPPEIGTKYTEGIYEYSYGQEYYTSWNDSNLNGWGVRVIDKTQTSYIQPLEEIQGQPVASYFGLFRDYPNETLTLEGTWTNKNITNIRYMFDKSQATNLDLSSFDTSKVTNMMGMFYGSQATSLDLSSFDTSKVTDMSQMFYLSEATSLNLTNFDTSNVTNMSSMFEGSQATTGYAGTQADANNFNTSSGKPSTLTFIVK